MMYIGHDPEFEWAPDFGTWQTTISQGKKWHPILFIQIFVRSENQLADLAISIERTKIYYLIINLGKIAIYASA